MSSTSLPKLEIRSNRLCSPVKEGKQGTRSPRRSPDTDYDATETPRRHHDATETPRRHHDATETPRSPLKSRRSPNRSPKSHPLHPSHPLHIIESDIQRISIGSPIPRAQADDDAGPVGFTPRRGSNCPSIKVDIVDRKTNRDRRISPSSSLLSSRSGSDLYVPSSLQQSRSENDLRGTGRYGTGAGGSLGGSPGGSGALSARGEGLLTARGPHPTEALCSPVMNRRPVRLLPLRHSSTNSLQGE